MGLPRWLSGKESACQTGDLGWEDPLKKKKITPTPVFWPAEFHGHSRGMHIEGVFILRADWGLGGRSEGKQRALVGGGWGELKMSQDIPPQRLATKWGPLIRRRAWGSLSSVFQLSPLSPLAFTEYLHCAAHNSLLWKKGYSPQEKLLSGSQAAEKMGSSLPGAASSGSRETSVPFPSLPPMCPRCQVVSADWASCL